MGRPRPLGRERTVMVLLHGDPFPDGVSTIASLLIKSVKSILVGGMVDYDASNCTHCNAPAKSHVPHPDATFDAETGSWTRVVCAACWRGHCDCDDQHAAECYVCGTQRHVDAKWYRTPEDVFGEWVCPDCGRRREKAIEHEASSYEQSGTRVPPGMTTTTERGNR